MFYEDSKKIGVGMICLGLFFYTLGVFWFLDRGFLCIGNLSFFLGIIALVGPYNTFLFFSKPSKRIGSAFFFGGFLLIIIGWFLFTTVGFGMQIYGLLMLFRSFIRTIFSYI